MQTNGTQKSGPNEQQMHPKQPVLRERTDKAWFIAFYDNQPGNGAGLFCQPRSPYRAQHGVIERK